MKAKFKVGDKVIVDFYRDDNSRQINVNAIITDISKEEDSMFEYALYTPHDDQHSAWYWEDQLTKQ